MNGALDANDLLQAMPCGCVVFDDTGKIAFINDALCTLLGYNESSLIDQNVERIFTVSTRIFYQTQLYALIRLKGKADEIFMSLRSEKGDAIPVMLYGKTHDIYGKSGFLFIFITTFERQKYELELQKLKVESQQVLEDNEVLGKLKEELELQYQQLDQQVSMLKKRNHEYIQLNKVLSHDMEEPIRKIAIFTDILLHRNKKPHEADVLANLQKVEKSIVRLRNLTSSLRQFTDVDTIEENITVLSANSLIEESCKKLHLSLEKNSFSLIVGKIPDFEGRASQIKLVFSALFKNAFENRKKDQTSVVTITAVIIEENTYLGGKGKYRYTDHLRLEISDNGNGFDHDYETYVFGLFNKLDAKSAGAGLGLALCKQIITSHYGTITARSSAGIGTTFIITIPLVQPE